MTDTQKELTSALGTLGYEAMAGKGGFFLRNHGFVTTAQARKMTGIKAPERNFRPVMSAYGDWATVAAINHVK
jgi:hypothetical protein